MPTTAQRGAANASLTVRRSQARPRQASKSGAVAKGAIDADAAVSAAATVRAEPIGTPATLDATASSERRRKWKATMGAVAIVAAALAHTLPRIASRSRRGQP